MAIRNYREEEFQKVLYDHLSPSTPISNIQLLKGREKTLQQIKQALLSPGRHVFIFGDRGVGKTSLAQTAAFLHQSSEREPIILSCSSPFFSLVRDLIGQCRSPTKKLKKTTLKVGVSPFASAEQQFNHDDGPLPEVYTINEAISLLRAGLREHSKQPVVIFDEFDLLPSQEDRKHFAEFLKQISDQKLQVKLIFTGIGRSITDLLAGHDSAVRYLENVSLDRLDYSARIEIVTGAATALGLEVGHDTCMRIAKVSDGFPHYVHLICEKMFWNLFNKCEIVDRATASDYVQAIGDAARSIQAFLHEPYKVATRKYTDDYEEILWAVADSPALERSSSQIFQSYKRILNSLPQERKLRDERSIAAQWFGAERDEEVLRKKFNGRINRLKTTAHGSILIGTRAGWYEYRENIVRGYVRLRAEEAGVPLEVDHPLLGHRYHEVQL